MGLTLHYSLKSDATTAEEARAVVSQLHEQAKKLPFSQVHEIVEFVGREECDFQAVEQKGAMRWLLCQTGQLVERKDQEGWIFVSAIHVIAFIVDVGDGCENANFGLCLYPKRVEHEGRQIKTGMDGWRWASFCKTQYASNPASGGVKNFLRCHLGLVNLLEYAKEIGVLEEVKDESHFWDNRDVEALVQETGRWNQMIAGFYGKMRDDLEGSGGDPADLKSIISEFPDFERLEAKGRRDETED